MYLLCVWRGLTLLILVYELLQILATGVEIHNFWILVNSHKHKYLTFEWKWFQIAPNIHSFSCLIFVDRNCLVVV